MADNNLFILELDKMFYELFFCPTFFGVITMCVHGRNKVQYRPEVEEERGTNLTDAERCSYKKNPKKTHTAEDVFLQNWTKLESPSLRETVD